MKKLPLLSIVCAVTTFCTPGKDTEPADVWVRAVEPRFTIETRWQPCRGAVPAGSLVHQTICGTAQPAPRAATCDAVRTHEEALHVLALRPGCTDVAVAALEGLAAGTPAVLADVAAAHYLRAQREDRPADLLGALEAAEKSLEEEPQLVAAHYNRALALEALALREEAVLAWNEVLKRDRSAWSGEARARRDRLQRELATAGPAQWERNRARLAEALRTRDEATIARLIAPFISSAHAYLEEELLRRGDASARTLAAALRRVTGDDYPVDAASGGAPDLAAELDRARMISFQPNQTSRALSMVDGVLERAEERRYRHIAARAQALRGYILWTSSRSLEALTALDRAREAFARLNDPEGVARARVRTFGILRELGQHQLAAREALLARRDAVHLARPSDAHLLEGETAMLALALGHRRAALVVQNAAVRRAAGNPDHLAIALRERAGIELRLDRPERAEADLREAARLRPRDADDAAAAAIEARLQEMNGKALVTTRPTAAAAAFTRAIALIEGGKYRSFVASLYAQRAEAHRRAGRRADAEGDLRNAIDVIAAQHAALFERRGIGEGERIWASYFLRFQDTYELLIRHLMEDGRPAEAFVYAERARALEPLDLIVRRNAAPPAFAALLGSGETRHERIRAMLPPDTFLIAYSLHDEQAYAWILSRERFEALALPVTRAQVERWRDDLAAAARRSDALQFDRPLDAMYAGLLERPMARIAAAGGGATPHLVIVPDEAMHGLPFAAMRNPRDGGYLVQRATVSLAGSALLYAYSLSRDADLPATAAPRVLLFGDPAFDRSSPLTDGLSRLPAAEREVRRIGALYAPHAQLRIAAQATVPEFLRLARGQDVIHVAGHAIANAEVPSRSMLLLAHSERHSGLLDAEELLTRLRLDRTRLVVLSACSSAGGLAVGPQGLAPLVRPLITAGAPAVVGTLWNVDDATAEELLVSFHRHYREGRNAAEALRSAQLDLLRSEKPGLNAGHTWAAFQVIGHASSPSPSARKERRDTLGLHSQNLLQRSDDLHPQ